LTLQVVAEAMAGFSQGSSNPLKDDRLERFDLSALVARFDQQSRGRTVVNPWSITSSLTQFHLGGSDTDAVGGDLAYRYGLNGSLAGLSADAARDVIGASGFGVVAQSLGSVGLATPEQRALG